MGTSRILCVIGFAFRILLDLALFRACASHAKPNHADIEQTQHLLRRRTRNRREGNNTEFRREIQNILKLVKMMRIR
jgi:hypothetical protein